MADPKATPISALPKAPGLQGDEDQQFIQTILNQVNNDNQESEQAYQQVQQNYNKQQFAPNHGEQHARNQRAIKKAKKQKKQAQIENFEDDTYEDFQYPEEEEVTFLDKVKRDIKAPVLFIFLFFILCLPPIRILAIKQISRFTQNANIQVYGSTLVLGVIGAIIFYLINTFALKF